MVHAKPQRGGCRGSNKLTELTVQTSVAGHAQSSVMGFCGASENLRDASGSASTVTVKIISIF